MTIFLNCLFLVLGMTLLIKGADFFVSGASAIAKKCKVPTLFIGLTIVALGTSLPELSVSITSAISNSIDLSVGNIVGSNLFNMLLIMGFVALFSPVPMSSSSKKIDLPFLVAITGMLLLFSLDKLLNGLPNNVLSRTESIMFLVILILYLYILISNANKSRNQLKNEHLSKENIEGNSQEENKKELKVWQIILYVVIGLSAVVFGGECVSTTSQFLAIKMGMSEALVGLTIVALGTSLPELATSVVASRKGENDIALGNVVGSNIINISLILGSVGVISQAPISSIIITDIIILFVCTVIFSIMCAKKDNISKVEGIILLILYIAYLAFAIIRNYCF